jgi:hypothetical protein
MALPGLIMVGFGSVVSRSRMRDTWGAHFSGRIHFHGTWVRKARIFRFKNLPPFRHDPGLQIPRLRYSPGLAPTTRLNALLNAASDS